MNTFEDLNVYGETSLEYTELRDAEVVFDRAAADNQTETVATGQSHTVPVGINIIDIAVPDDLDIYYEINVSSVTGATVSWATVPTGCTVTNPSTGIYRLNFISTVAHWDTVRSPTINIPIGQEDNFSYTAAIKYNPSQTKSWTVAVTVTMLIAMTAQFTIDADTGQTFSMEADLTSTFTGVFRGGRREQGLAAMSSQHSLTARGGYRKYAASAMSASTAQSVSGRKVRFLDSAMTATASSTSTILRKRPGVGAFSSTSQQTTVPLRIYPLLSTQNMDSASAATLNETFETVAYFTPSEPTSTTYKSKLLTNLEETKAIVSYRYDLDFGGPGGENDNTFSTGWDNSYAYPLGDIIYYSGNMYVSLQNSNLNHDPTSSPAWWEQITLVELIDVGGYVDNQYIGVQFATDSTYTRMTYLVYDQYNGGTSANSYVKMWSRSGATWTLNNTFNYSNTSDFQQATFVNGTNITISGNGNRVMLNGNNRFLEFNWSGSTWSYSGSVITSLGSPDYNTGGSTQNVELSYSGDYFSFYRDNISGYSERSYIYYKSSGTWTQQAQIIDTTELYDNAYLRVSNSDSVPQLSDDEQFAIFPGTLKTVFPGTYSQTGLEQLSYFVYKRTGTSWAFYVRYNQ